MLEMVSVIFGVLIALAVSEVVQNWHWAEDVAEARASIQEEIRSNNDIFAYRVMLRPCLDAKLERVRKGVEALAAGIAAGPLDVPDLTTGGRLDDQNWQALRTSQTFAHFPEKERTALGAYYSQLSDTKTWFTEESATWSELSLIGFAPSSLERADVSRMRLATHRAAASGALIGVNAARQLRRSQSILSGPLLAKAPRYWRYVKHLRGACAYAGHPPQSLRQALLEAQP